MKVEKKGFMEESLNYALQLTTTSLSLMLDGDVRFEPVVVQDVRDLPLMDYQSKDYVWGHKLDRIKDVNMIVSKQDGLVILSSLLASSSDKIEMDEFSLSALAEVLCKVEEGVYKGLSTYLGKSLTSYKLRAQLGYDGDVRHLMDAMVASRLLMKINEQVVELIMFMKEEVFEAAQPEAIKNAQVNEEVGIKDVELPKFNTNAISGNESGHNMDLIMNVPLNVSIEIGTATKKIKDIMDFSNGTVIELDKQTGAPVDIVVNGQLIARGDVVVIDENFAIRVTEIVNKNGLNLVE